MATIIFIASLLLGIYLFWQKTVIFMDPDFGWQIHTGRYILERLSTTGLLDAIPTQDVFSYTMPGFPYAPHSWLTDVLFVLIYNSGGYNVLAILTSVATIAAFFISLWYVRKNPLTFSMLFTAGVTCLLSYISLRPQVFSWLFFSYVCIVIFEKKLWHKLYWTLPIFFVVWVNMHAGFALGIVLLIFQTIYHLANAQNQLKKNPTKNTFYTKQLIFVTIISCCATLINPNFTGIWREVVLTIFDFKLHTDISEWRPLILRMSEFYIPYLGISLVFVIKESKSLPRNAVFFYFLLFAAALSSSKLFPFWLFLSLYVTGCAIESFRKHLPGKDAQRKFRLVMFTLFILTSATLVLYVPRIWQTFSVFSEETFYANTALRKAIKHTPAGQNIFTPSLWGGYLLLQAPNRKVFVDGRMTYWTDPNASSEFSTDAYSEAIELILLEVDAQKTLDKYNVSTVFIPKTSLYPSFSTFAERMTEIGWIKGYEDDNAYVFYRPDSI